MKNNKTLWVFPWKYKESFSFVFGLIFIAFALQLFVGNFDFYLLHNPINLILVGLLILLVAVGTYFRKNPIIAWLSSVHLAIAQITAFIILGLIMGLIPQVMPSGHVYSVLDLLGLTTMTSSWPFVILYTLTLITLALTCARRALHFKRQDLSFVFMHFGLCLVLVAAGFGTADMQRHIMHVQEGESEWRVYADDGTILELPIAIKLIDFGIDEYPPKLALIDKDAGQALPLDKPEWLQIDLKYPQGNLGDWQITIQEYLHDAVWAGNGAYREMTMPSSSPAVKIRAQNIVTKAEFEGWISGGQMSQFVKALFLDDNLAVVMSQPEPKRFYSHITVATQDGVSKEATLEVNSPLVLGAWIIYQYGYDNELGKESNYSSFELVYDPWLPVVYLGLIFMSLGAILLVCFGKKRVAL